ALSVLKSGARVNVLPTIWVDKLKEAGEQKSLEVSGYKAQRSGNDMARVLQLVADGQLTLKIQKIYPLSEVVAAHHELQKGDAFGKIVLAASE
ncbi:MAG TPA: NADP-dependent oxidoreductase, partial [Psychrobacter sp.]|nr:NADP-dependent oxidoreductase [Psychrobacter sp.]